MYMYSLSVSFDDTGKLVKQLIDNYESVYYMDFTLKCAMWT